MAPSYHRPTLGFKEPYSSSPKRWSMRRKLMLLAAPSMYLFFSASCLYPVRDRIGQPTPPGDLLRQSQHAYNELYSHVDLKTQAVAVEPSDGLVLPGANITTYIDEILSRKETQLRNLKCPAVKSKRYEILNPASRGRDSNARNSIQYFFAIDLRQSLPILPSLLGSVIQAAKFLGPDRCALSIVEGNSDDGTGDVLTALKPELENLGMQYRLHFSSIDPSKGNRIERLAELRNLALQPLTTGDIQAAAQDDDEDDSTIIFLNDVALCPDDILELVLQKRKLGADMTCAMDWTYVGRDPTFYDVWVARGINGDSFFEIPPDGNWNSAWNLFWNAGETQARFFARRPFQVFSCWNGATAFTSRPFLPSSPAHERISFRAPDKPAGECDQGEPQLFCKDMWHRGFGKIAVVPAVNLEYSIEKAEMIKEAKGFTAGNVAHTYDDTGDGIAWRLDPPQRVKCIPSYENQFWQNWNETLT